VTALIARSLLSVLALPVMVAFVLPAWIVVSWADVDGRWTHAGAVLGGMVIGVALFLAGFALVAWCVTLFARVGKGTLAPWDPTKELVVIGPYRHVRNPMISGVAGMLLGEALFFGSAFLAGWFLLFVLINHTYFILSEEPGLERRFGFAYTDYRRRVPRWLPRRKGV
jgi:protein-S-isoprenylcysteine O-methyltransferase Ste14